MRRLFRGHHRLRENPADDRQNLVKAAERRGRTIVRSPADRKAENIAKRFLENGDSYLRFSAKPEIEPTNNRAEQAMRQAVIDRASSQGTRSPNGRACKERIGTVLTTCVMRGTLAFGFIRQALRA